MRECEDTRAAASAARDEIEARSRTVSQQIPSVRSDLARAAQAVLWPEGRAAIRQLVTEARAAQRAYAEKAALAKFMHDLAAWPYPEGDPDAAELRSIVTELGIAPLDWRSARGGADPAEG